MSITKKKFSLIKSKQFTSKLLSKECYAKGINTRVPFVHIPKRLVRFLFRKFRNLFDSVKLSKGIKKRIEHLQMIRTYKGIRHRKGLPVRGQRTHTNAKTRKKSRKNMDFFSRQTVKVK